MNGPNTGNNSRLLIVNADDYGLTPGVCDAILHARDHGIVRSTSALVVAPAWRRYSRPLESSGLGVGAHLCAVGEDPPLLSASEIPSLVVGGGRFRASWREFVAAAARGRIDPDDLRREFGAQLDALDQAGVPITHIDTHQHVHLWPSVAAVVIDLAVGRSIAAVRRPRSSRRSLVGIGVGVLSRAFGRRATAARLLMPETFGGLDTAGRQTGDVLTGAIDDLGRSAATTAELGTHPGLDDDPERVRYVWNYSWAEEFEALCAPDALQAVARHGFELGTFEDLRRLGGAM